MATQVQNRRGTTAEHSTFTGANGELTVDTTKRTLVVHDGATAGGRPLLREDQSNLPTSAPTTGIYNASGSLAISTGGSGRLFVDASGNVGVGTTGPAYALDVQGGQGVGIQIFETSSGTNRRLRVTQEASGATYDATFGSSDNAHRWLVGGGERARIDSSGRLLVGTSSAIAASPLLQVEQTTGGEIALGRQDTSVVNNDLIGGIGFWGRDTAGVAYAEQASVKCFADGIHDPGTNPTRLAFFTTADGASSPTERMRIDNTGGILFGRTVLGNIGDSLGIAFGGGGAGYAYFERSGGAGIYVRRATSTGNAVEFYQGTNTYVGSISVTASATAYNTSSDYRLKENVKLVTDGINRLQQLKPSRFNFIADPDTVVDGFIAHEVQAVVPEAITGEKDAVDEDGNPVYQGIDQSKLVPLLTAALQEAIGEIESLKARVATLETA